MLSNGKCLQSVLSEKKAANKSGFPEEQPREVSLDQAEREWWHNTMNRNEATQTRLLRNDVNDKENKLALMWFKDSIKIARITRSSRLNMNFWKSSDILDRVIPQHQGMWSSGS